jgi:3',5'-cyclic AMP phosphodiesterase CpdA
LGKLVTPFRLAHISDPQLSTPALPWRAADLISKRALSRWAWRRKRHSHTREALDCITAHIRAAAPDHMAVTGDLVNFSLPEEFAAARTWLGTLGDPATVTVSPGNHDALSSRGAPAGFAPWRPWLGDEGDGFPYLRIRRDVAILNLSSAVPTAPLLAQGQLGRGQIEAARERLSSTGARGLFRVVLLHHPPQAHGVSDRKALTDAAMLRDMLAETGAELILHGHAHRAMLGTVAGPSGPIPVLGAPSASTPPGAPGEPGRWNEIAISRLEAGFRIDVTAQGFDADLRVQRLGRFRLV